MSDINRSETKLSGEHIVQSGETLYAIGWRYNRDFKELAAANGIPPPYVIHTGQKISLEPVKSNSNVVIGAVEPKPQIVAVTPSIENTVMQPVSPAVKQTPIPAQGPVVMPATISSWQWPVKGEILARFAQSKGVDIAGVEGQVVHAAADGRVVYSGNGLRGYGQLLIIKHNEQYLSAYAHNSQLTVKEGDWVKQGQPIAQMGSTDTNRVKLHFEIRQDGKPVDPLKYLPK